MIRPFTGLHAEKFIFRRGEHEREVIAIYAGYKRLGFADYDAARKLCDEMHDLCDAHEAELREGKQ